MWKKKLPLSAKRMLPVFIGVFIIIYSFIVIAKYTKMADVNDAHVIAPPTTTVPLPPPTNNFIENNNKAQGEEQEKAMDNQQQQQQQQEEHEEKAEKIKEKEEDDDDKEDVQNKVDIKSNGLRKTHVFYYPWYANMETDGAWNHWNHRILGHWNPEIAQRFQKDVNYVPPDDIGCSFYPKLGPYSSMDDKVISEHMEKLKDYVVVMSWWGRPDVKDAKDGEGYSTDLVMPKLFKAAEKTGAKIAFHLEPYPCK